MVCSLNQGRSPRVGSGYPPQYSCLESSIDRGAWRATVHRAAKSWTWRASAHTRQADRKDDRQANALILKYLGCFQFGAINSLLLDEKIKKNKSAAI